MSRHWRTPILGLSGLFLAFGCTQNNANQPQNSEFAQSTESRPTSTVTLPSSTANPTTSISVPEATPVLRATGAQALVQSGFEPLIDQRVGLIANQTSVTDEGHLADILANEPSVELVSLFAPEHGLRGEALAGEFVPNSVDPATGVEIFSLYGQTRKPDIELLKSLDVLVFDLQDVGARFYTFISTMGLAMQAAAEANIGFVVLDRPNPQGGLSVAGFTQTPDQESFVGQYPIPSKYGLTSGELALAIKGENWLPGLENLDLHVVKLHGWTRDMLWTDWGAPWIAPSPALPTVEAAYAYPGVVLFEATNLDYGRGTESPFLRIVGEQIDGDELAVNLNSRGLPGVRFTSEIGGVRYDITDANKFETVSTGLHVLEAFLAGSPLPIIDRPEIFDQLAGTTELRTLLESGVPATAIVDAWREDVAAFESVRNKYFLY